MPNSRDIYMSQRVVTQITFCVLVPAQNIEHKQGVKKEHNIWSR
jgi:hypothetical protein